MSKRDSSKPRIDVKETTAGIHPVGRRFPGPQSADSPMRVATERAAFAEITAHARELLDVEVGGVLVGNVCEDDEGVWVHIEAVVRGTAARQANTHVTFTQETWTLIHEAIERDHKGRRIVGWYHTHPGFGVEFSEMDLFIQRNFFPDPAQVALVTDPLGGAIAICMNSPAGVEYLDRFWVDGREQPCRRPAGTLTADRKSTSGAAPGGDSASDAIQALEGRVSQLLQAIEETRKLYYRVLSSAALLFCAVVIGVAAYFVFQSFRARTEPPKLNSIVPIPVRIGDRTIHIGLAVVEWQVPDELNAVYVQAGHDLAEKVAAAAAQMNAATPATPEAPGVSPANSNQVPPPAPATP